MIMNPIISGTSLPELTIPAGAGQILSGYQAINEDGEIITGTIASRGAQTITPGTSNQTIAAGQYLSGTQTIVGDSDLVAGNIKSGVNIFGVTGSYSGEDVQFADIPLNNISLGNSRITINWPYPIKQLCGLQLYGHKEAQTSNRDPCQIFLIYPCLYHVPNDDGTYPYYPNAFSRIEFEREESSFIYNGTLSIGVVMINSITSTQLITDGRSSWGLDHIDEWYGACYSYIPA